MLSKSSPNILLYALLTSLTGFTLDTILPVVPEIAASVSNVHQLGAPLVITLVIFGMVFGEIVFGPLSDAFGRKRAIIGGLAVFLVGTFCVLIASSYELILIGRILQGFGVSGPKIGTRALIRDQYTGPDMAHIMSLIFSILIFVPMIAPYIGQTISQLFGWRGAFWFLIVLGSNTAIWLALGQEETLTTASRQEISIFAMLANVGLILQHRQVVAYTAIAGLVFGIQLFFLSIAVSIFEQSYQLVDTFVYWFTLLAASMATGSLLNSRLVRYWSMVSLVAYANFGLFIVGAILVLLAYATSYGASFPIFIASLMLVFFCIGIIFGNINAMAMVHLGGIAGLGASFIASISSLIAFGVAAFFGLLHDGTPQALSVLILLSSVAVFLLLTFSKSGIRKEV